MVERLINYLGEGGGVCVERGREAGDPHQSVTTFNFISRWWVFSPLLGFASRRIVSRCFEGLSLSLGRDFEICSILFNSVYARMFAVPSTAPLFLYFYSFSLFLHSGCDHICVYIYVYIHTYIRGIQDKG